MVNLLKAGTDIMFKKKRRLSQVAGQHDQAVDSVLSRHSHLRSPPKRFMTEEGQREVPLRQPLSDSRARVRDEPMEMEEERKTPEAMRAGRTPQQNDEELDIDF